LECGDEGEIHSLDHCDERHGRPTEDYYPCESCPRCAHCDEHLGDAIKTVFESIILYLPDLDGFPVGWCSPGCLHSYCDAQPDSYGTAKTLLDDWRECHYGWSGLELTVAKWIQVRFHRERRTYQALLDEWWQQHREQASAENRLDRVASA